MVTLEVEKKLPVSRWSRCKRSNDCGYLIRQEDVTEVGLIYGTQAGFLVGWKEVRKAEGVSALEFFS